MTIKKYNFEELKKMFNWETTSSKGVKEQIDFAKKHGVTLQFDDTYGNKNYFSIIEENTNNYTLVQLMEKYNWPVKTTGIPDFVNYAKARGLIVEKQLFSKRPLYFKIIDDTIANLNWVECNGHKEFEVCKEGYVRNAKTKKLLGAQTRHGYKQVKGNNAYYMVHRLIMETFNPCVGMETLYVDHIDGVRTHNNIENLRWATAAQNLAYRQDNWNIISNNLNTLIQYFGYEGTNDKLQEIIDRSGLNDYPLTKN